MKFSKLMLILLLSGVVNVGVAQVAVFNTNDADNQSNQPSQKSLSVDERINQAFGAYMQARQQRMDAFQQQQAQRKQAAEAKSQQRQQELQKKVKQVQSEGKKQLEAFRKAVIKKQGGQSANGQSAADLSELDQASKLPDDSLLFSDNASSAQASPTAVKQPTSTYHLTRQVSQPANATQSMPADTSASTTTKPAMNGSSGSQTKSPSSSGWQINY